MKITDTTLLLVQVLQARLPQPQLEYRFHPTRKWRFDVAWPDLLLAVEIEGGAYTEGRHTRGQGFENDMTKYNEALVLGWQVLRVTPAMVQDGRALAWLQAASGIRSPKGAG